MLRRGSSSADANAGSSAAQSAPGALYQTHPVNHWCSARRLPCELHGPLPVSSSDQANYLRGRPVARPDKDMWNDRRISTGMPGENLQAVGVVGSQLPVIQDAVQK
jgi:hypothetical protein